VQDNRKTPIETRLAAYADGEISREEKAAVEELLSKDADARRIYETLRHGSDIGRKAFDEILKEPVPLALVRSIKSAQPPKPREARRTRPSLKLAPNGRQALAAALILFAVGCGIGYLFGTQPGASRLAQQPAQAQSRLWPDDIATAHRIYLRQQSHIVEVQATQIDEIQKWLNASVGVKFNLPDLASEGLIFQGARLVVAAGKPTGQLVYKTVDGEIIAVCFVKDDTATGNADFNEVIKDDIGIVSWHRGGIGYAVVGVSSDPLLDDIANRVSTEI
jgi:anti-sigma factor RsiW